jgi:hypothetical protein
MWLFKLGNAWEKKTRVKLFLKRNQPEGSLEADVTVGYAGKT